MSETLSAEFFYPDCPSCGEDGGLLVMKSHHSGDWHCLSCDELFDTPEGSPWSIALRLDEPARQSFIDCEIRGLSASESAAHRNLSQQQVAGHLSLAKSPDTKFSRVSGD